MSRITLSRMIVSCLCAAALLATSATAAPPAHAQSLCDPTSEYVVVDLVGFADALLCHNAAATGPTQISFDADIFGGVPDIDNPNAISLEIDGGGYTFGSDPATGGGTLFAQASNTGDITVRNLMVAPLQLGYGIRNASTTRLTADNVTVTQSLGDGVSGDGPVVVTNSTLSNNEGNGIFSRVSVDVSDSVIAGNGIEGVNSQGTAMVVRVAASGNGTGADGINAVGSVGDMTVIDSHVFDNLKHGIYGGGTTTVTDTLVEGNTYNGIFGLGQLTVTGSTVTGNGQTGVHGHTTTAISNTFIDTNGARGATAGGYLTIEDSTLFGNGAPAGHSGADSAAGVSFIRSVARGNTGHGVVSSQPIIVEHSVIENNGAAPGNHVGVGSNSTVTVSSSAIIGNDGGLGSNLDVIVENSTIANNGGRGIGIGGAGTVTSSTIVNNDQDGLGVYGVAASGLQLVSSIVDSCTGVGDGGNNIGGCFFTDPTSLRPLADNGCAVEAGTLDSRECPVTAALGTNSNATAAGSCGPAITTDQRGEPRPTSEPCDAGAYEASCDAVSFGDVEPGIWFEPAVQWAACAGITSGTSASAFSPTKTLTRAEMATFLWRYAGEPIGAPPASFADVSPGQWFEPPVAWLADTGITAGTAPGIYSPTAAVTRAQMATFLWRYVDQPAGAPPHTFVDVLADDWFDAPVSWMVDQGITRGTSDTTFSPGKKLSRAEAVTFLWRLAGEP